MTQNCLDIITQISVEIHKNDASKMKLGTGVIFANKQLSGKVYVLTAKHCLSSLADGEQVSLRIYNPKSCSYEYITPSNQLILCHPSEMDDAGIIIFSQRELLSVNDEIPSIFFVEHFLCFDEAVTKGFPIAQLDQKSETGESFLATLNMRYLQETPTDHTLQLSTLDDYTEDSIKGMSGSGIFIEVYEELYINGIFTRFSDEERGKVIYSERLASFNELLGKEYKKKIPLSFVGHHGLGHKTFENNVEQAIDNLGPRYCQKVNVKTGTAKYIDCVAKTPGYYDRLYKRIDAWLTEKNYRTRNGSSRIGNLELKLKELRKDFATSLAELDRSVEASIDFSDLMNEVSVLKNEVEVLRSGLYSEMPSTDKSIRSEIEADESRLLEISSDLYSFSEDYEDLRIDLANNPYLVISGQAGCGKSHMMGDVAKIRIAAGLPTLLFLGTDFNDGTYESVIISKIGFNGTFQEFLSSFNQIGTQVGSRALIMIDAINEGPNANLWKNRLPGLIHSIDDYPAVGLVVSVRDTYFNDVIPDDIREKSHATIIEHKGFKGLEYEAVKQFCMAYDLHLPNVPILTPEFCNPLFLKIVCDTLDATGKKDFPKGFNGISAIFNEYFVNLDKQFSIKRTEYKYLDVVSASIELLAIPIFDAQYNLLNIQDAYSILQKQFPSCPCLLTDLIDSNVLLKTKSAYNEDRGDFVVFSYQRISDFIIAKELVKKYPVWETFIKNIQEDKNLRAVFIESHWMFKGIIEALAILMPETYGHEVFDVLDYLPKAKYQQYGYTNLDTISEALINSLCWRSIESINTEQIRTFLSSNNSRVQVDQWYNKLVELSVIQNHPFNADYFHKLLMRGTMKERDAEFQFFFNGCAGYDDDNCANPMRRLIDWAWSKDISQNSDKESARLAAIMLCWLLSSTYIKHRDEATKALVNLLTEKVDTLIEIMRSFRTVDDMYIYERIFAVAYGVALRTSSSDGLLNLSKYVYDTIFKHNNPPKNVLLRDYARNIVEYAYFKFGKLSYNMKKVRPPYSTVLPEWPEDTEIECLHIDYDDPDFKNKKGSEQNMIWESVKGGLADFWNKLALPKIEQFYPISISEEKKYESAERLFKGDIKKCVRVYSEAKAREHINRTEKSTGRKSDDPLLTFFYEAVESLLSKEQMMAVNDIMIPFKIKQLPLINDHFIRFPAEGVRNWLVKKSYELGFDVELHGKYDSFAKDWTFRHSDDRIDRIGKKYQWIAFYEIMGILSDNFKYEDEYANNGRGGYELFHGAWQSYLRNINPSLIARDKSIESEAIEDQIENGANAWYKDETYDNWDYIGSDELWSSMIKDLPDPISFIQKVDDDGTEWLTLNNSRSWDEPKDIGKEKYQHKLKRHDVSMFADAILVNQQDEEKAIFSLDNRDLWDGIEIPTDDWQYLINREKFWSPAYQDVYRSDQDKTGFIKGLDVPYTYSCEQACGHIEGDKSGTINRYSIPCRAIFEGLGMDYNSDDCQYIDENGELVAISYGYDQILVKKAPLLNFLKRNRLAILWIVRGEKRVYVSGGMGCICDYSPCGVYHLDCNNNPKGELKMYKRV